MEVGRMNESEWSQKMRKRAKELFANVVIFKLSNPYVAALPDSTYTYKGMTTWIEVKREYNKPTELQRFNMKALYEQNGGRSYFIRVLDKTTARPVQFQIRSGHDWDVLLLHSGTLDNVLKHIVQWRE